MLGFFKPQVREWLIWAAGGQRVSKVFTKGPSINHEQAS